MFKGMVERKQPTLGSIALRHSLPEETAVLNVVAIDLHIVSQEL